MSDEYVIVDNPQSESPASNDYVIVDNPSNEYTLSGNERSATPEENHAFVKDYLDLQHNEKPTLDQFKQFMDVEDNSPGAVSKFFDDPLANSGRMLGDAFSGVARLASDVAQGVGYYVGAASDPALTEKARLSAYEGARSAWENTRLMWEKMKRFGNRNVDSLQDVYDRSMKIRDISDRIVNNPNNEHIEQSVKELAGFVTDPVNVAMIPLSLGVGNAAERAVMGALQKGATGVGGLVTRAGEMVSAAGNLGEKATLAAARMAPAVDGISAAAAEDAAQKAASGAMRLGIADKLGSDIQNVGKALKIAGQEAGEKSVQRYSLLENVARSPDLAENPIIRGSIGAVAPIEKYVVSPLVKTAAHSLEPAAVMGALSAAQGENPIQGAAQGFAFGATLGGASRVWDMASGNAYKRNLYKDAVNKVQSMPAEQQPAAMGLINHWMEKGNTREVARLIDARKLSDAKWDLRRASDMPPGMENVAGVTIPGQVEGDPPTIIINVDHAAAAKGTAVEELWHSILDSDPQNQFINTLKSELFGVKDAQGNVVKDGLLTLDQLRQFGMDYSRRFGGESLADLQKKDLTPEEMQLALRENKRAAFEQKLQQGLGESRSGGNISPTLDHAIDELGARAWLAFLNEKPEDYLLRRGDIGFARELFSRAIDAAVGVFEKQADRAGWKKTDGGKWFEGLYDENGKRITSPALDAMMEDMAKLVRHNEAGDASLDIGNMKNEQRLKIRDAYKAQGVINEDGSLKTVKQVKAEEAAKTQAMMDTLAAMPAEDRTSTHVTDPTTGKTMIRGALSDKEVDALLKSGHLDEGGAKAVKDVMAALRDNTFSPIYDTIYWAASADRGGRKTYATLKPTRRLVVPYDFFISKADGFVIRGVDWSAVQRRIDKIWDKQPEVQSLFKDKAEMQSQFRDYLGNLSKLDAKPSAEFFGGGVDGVKKRNAFYEALGTVPRVGQDLINPQRQGYIPTRGKDFPFTSFRVERITRMDRTPDSIAFREGSTYNRGQVNFQPPTETLKEHIKNLERGIGDPEENLRVALNRRPGTGVSKIKPITFTNKEGKPISIGGDVAQGGKPFKDWIAETAPGVWLSREQFDASRKWYHQVHDEFLKEFGEKDTPKVLMAWLASQQRKSPSQGMDMVLKYIDKAEGIDSLKGTKGGLAWEKVQSILADKPPEGGYGGKLSDFADAGSGKLTRTYVGDDPRGGQPFVADVWTGRDSGSVDEVTIGRLVDMANKGDLFAGGQPLTAKVTEYVTKKVGGEETRMPIRARFYLPDGKGFSIKRDFSGSPYGAPYEGMSRWGNDLSKHLNDIGFEGGGWTAPEAQAVGWMRTQLQYGIDPENIDAILQRNTQNVFAELNYDFGSKLPAAYPSLKSLPLEVAKKITEEVVGKTMRGLSQIIGGSAKYIRDITLSTGSWHGDSNPNVIVRLMSTKEAADQLAIAYSLVDEQGGALRVTIEKGSKRAFLLAHSDGTPLSDVELAQLRDHLKSLNDPDFSGDTVMQDGSILFASREDKNGNTLPLTDASSERMINKIKQWSEKNSLDLEARTVNCESQFYGNNWTTEKEGQSYREALESRRSREVIRQVLDYRKTHAEHIEDAFSANAPGVLDPAKRQERVSSVLFDGRRYQPASWSAEDLPDGKFYRHPDGYRIVQRRGSNSYRVYEPSGVLLGVYGTVEKSADAAFKDASSRYGARRDDFALSSKPSTESTKSEKIPGEKDGRVPLRHWSTVDLSGGEIDPSFHGKGLAGGESARKKEFPNLWVDRSYFGLQGYKKEGGLGQELHRIDAPASGLYDIVADPNGYEKKAFDLLQRRGGNPNDVAARKTLTEKLVKQGGYLGYFNRDQRIAALFHEVPGEGAVPPSGDPSLRWQPETRWSSESLNGGTVWHSPGGFRVVQISPNAKYRLYDQSSSQMIGVYASLAQAQQQADKRSRAAVVN